MVRWGEKGPCVPCVKHVPSVSIECEQHKAIYLFHLTPYSPCGTILIGTNPICSKRMRRLVSIRGLYIRCRVHCLWNHTYMFNGFPFGRTQHVRCIGSSTINVIHHVSMTFFTSHVMSGITTCSFSVQK